MATSAERQRAFRERQRAAGLTAFAALVPSRHVGALADLVRRLREDESLEIGPLRNTRTGRLEKL